MQRETYQTRNGDTAPGAGRPLSKTEGFYAQISGKTPAAVGGDPLFVTFIIYLLMRCMPSSYVENMARQLSQAPGSKPYEEWLAQLNAQYGLDLGLIPGFFVQLKNLCTGNFGDSWKYTVPVIQKFNEVIWVSFIMGAISLVFELLIAVPLGIVAATKQYSVTDYTVTTVALLGMSLPTFFFATLLKLIFSVKLGWFDLVGLTGRDFNSLSQFGQILDMAIIWCCPS